MQLDYTVPTDRSFDDAVSAICDGLTAAGFRVLFVHDVSATLAEKGFVRERVSIIETCNAKYAHSMLARDVKIGLMLPCPVMVYEEAGSVLISTMRPTLIGAFFPEAGLDDVAGEVEAILTRVIDEAV